MVVVCGDENILVRRNGTRYYTYYITACDVACGVRRKRLIETVPEERLQSVLPEMSLNISCGPGCVPGAGGPSVIHVVCQPGHDSLLFGRIDYLFVHSVRSERTSAVLRLQRHGYQRYYD